MPFDKLPALIPRETLFGDPSKMSPQITPDARRLAYIAPLDGVLNIWAGSLEEDPASFQSATHDTERGIRTYFWAQDSLRIVYLQDAGGDENWRLYSTNVETGEKIDLTPFEAVQARILGVHKDHPDQIMIALNIEDPRLHDAYLVSLSSGELTKIAKNPGNIVSWIADADFRLRGAVCMLPDNSSQLLIRDPSEGDSAEWRLFRQWSAEDSLSSRPSNFTRDASGIYIIDSSNADTGRLTLVDTATGASEVIYDDPHFDVGGVILHPDTRALQAVTVTRDKTDWAFFDDAFADDFRRLRTIRSGEVALIGRDRADAVWLVAFTNDINTTQYYVYDRAARTTRHLFSARPELDAYTLAPMQPVKFSARDGLTLHGYFSAPVGVEPKGLPMVLDVHGGPWTRDRWGLDIDTQWFANRGYAVFKVNYRGSTGYGKKFLNAGNREWGAKMHDDLIDSVQWVIDRGIVDPRRVAIYGGSYGGYAALAGAAFTPDVFCCAIDIVGPSNLITLIQTIPPYWHALRSQFTSRVGDPETEAEFLRSRSPLFHVDRIKVPLLIAQGANDPRVKKAESDQIVAAMREKGLECEYLVFDDEGHGFVKPQNRLKFHAAAERFLAQHLGGRAEL